MQQMLLDGIALNQLFENGYRNLKKNMNVINDLNVFPVPDGDTGTNMSMTIGNALPELNKMKNDVDCSEVTKVMASALLRGAGRAARCRTIFRSEQHHSPLGPFALANAPLRARQNSVRS